MSGRLLHDDALVHRIVGAASAAPSIHNTQPWRFRIAGHDLIEVYADIDRMLWIADPKGRALHLSCGAALLNLRLALRASGYRPLVWPLPDPDRAPTLIASVQLSEGKPQTTAEREMFAAISLRHSSRQPYSDRPVPDAVLVAMEQEAATEGALLRILPAREVAIVLRLVEAAEHELTADREHNAELAAWIGTPERTGLGIPAQALAPPPEGLPGPVRDFGPHPAAVQPPAAYELQPKLAVLATARDQAADWLRAGQALQRVLLTATRHGLATSLLYQPMELHDMRDRDGWWPWPECPQLIVRYGYGPRASAARRQPVTAVLDEDRAAGR
jgi:nitroreductase